jgi:diphosphomevalonate decarboxylase
MSNRRATAVACPNIAFIKYWGNRDHVLRLPSNPSLSMNLDGLFTTTNVEFDPTFKSDQLILGGQPTSGVGLDRVSRFLDHVRQTSEVSKTSEVSHLFARVESANNFPSGAGIASSASAFAALAVAASAAAGLNLDEAQLSRLARLGSGSACRSVPGGFVEWSLGTDDQSSVARSIAPADHWDLIDLIAIVDAGHKSIGSTEGHGLADTSPLQAARVASAPDRLTRARSAILTRDFQALTEVVELDSLVMHGVMMTSTPSLMYWQPTTIAILHAVIDWRREGLSACATIDAGPNVHVLCLSRDAEEVKQRLLKISGVKEILSARPGGSAKLIERDE